MLDRHYHVFQIATADDGTEVPVWLGNVHVTVEDDAKSWTLPILARDQAMQEFDFKPEPGTMLRLVNVKDCVTFTASLEWNG